MSRPRAVTPLVTAHNVVKQRPLGPDGNEVQPELFPDSPRVERRAFSDTVTICDSAGQVVGTATVTFGANGYPIASSLRDFKPDRD